MAGIKQWAFLVAAGWGTQRQDRSGIFSPMVLNIAMLGESAGDQAIEVGQVGGSI